MNSELENLCISIPDVAKSCGVCINTARAMIKRKDFPKITVGRRILIPRDSFVNWLQKTAFNSH
jgi:putative SOS response-associated peptidase YedK